MENGRKMIWNALNKNFIDLFFGITKMSIEVLIEAIELLKMGKSEFQDQKQWKLMNFFSIPIFCEIYCKEQTPVKLQTSDASMLMAILRWFGQSGFHFVLNARQFFVLKAAIRSKSSSLRRCSKKRTL